MASHNNPDVGLGRMIGKRTALTPTNRALTFEGTTWTYAEFLDRIDRFADSLREGGITPGDRVGFLGFNHPVFLITMFAAARLGAIFVPLNFRLTASELDYIINDAGVHTIVADDAHKAELDVVRSQLPCERYVSAESGGEGWESLHEILAESPPLLQAAKVAADDVALIMYTSGTTGRPKGAMLTHGNIAWNNVNTLHGMEIGDVSLVVAPLFHIGGLNVTTLVTLQKGGEIVLHRNFDPGAALEAVSYTHLDVYKRQTELRHTGRLGLRRHHLRTHRGHPRTQEDLRFRGTHSGHRGHRFVARPQLHLPPCRSNSSRNWYRW